MSHTPGPWIAGKPLATGVVPIKSAVGRLVVAHVTHPDWGYEDTPIDAEECAANARLIAAAPALFRALECMLAEAERFPQTMHHSLAQARDAWAEATGESA